MEGKCWRRALWRKGAVYTNMKVEVPLSSSPK
jgi:hypothetical protein